MARVLELKAKILALGIVVLTTVSAQRPLDPLQRMQEDLGLVSVDDERAELKAQAEADPSNIEAWMRWCLFSYERDESEQTLAQIATALEQVGGDAPALLRLAAEIQFSDAQTGSQWISRPGTMRSRRLAEEVDEADYRARKLGLAEDALRRVLAVAPDDFESIQRLGFVLQQQGRWADALAYWDQRLAMKWHADFAAGSVLAAVELERFTDAEERLHQALDRAPHSPSLHFVAAQLHDAQGRKTEAREALRRAFFFNALLPESKLEFDEASWEAMVDLQLVDPNELVLPSEKPTADPAEELEEVDWEARENRLKRRLELLEEAGDDRAVELMAALIWRHGAHGSIEDEAVDWLAQNGQEIVLFRILDEAGSFCTVGNCLRGLALARAPGIFDRLVMELPKDGGMFPMRIIESMQLLDDPRTPGVLIDYLRSENPDRAEQALVALAEFETEECQRFMEQLEQESDDVTMKCAASAALYRWAPTKQRIRALRKAIKRHKSYEMWPVASILEPVDTAEAKALVKAWRKKADRD